MFNSKIADKKKPAVKRAKCELLRGLCVYLTGGTYKVIIHMKISFVKLMLIFYANIYEIKEKNSLCQSLLQLVNATYLYLYSRYG